MPAAPACGGAAGAAARAAPAANRPVADLPESARRAEPGPATAAAAHRVAGLVRGGVPCGLCVPGTAEGILTGVGVLYLAHAAAATQGVRLHVAGRCQPRLGEEIVDVSTDEPFARRVLDGFARAASAVDAWRVLYACQSDDPLRGEAVLSFVRRGFEVRGPLRPHRGEAATVPVFDLANAVRTECEHARQFMRFSRTADGVYRARFEPRADVVPLVMGHFAARFGSQPFLIHDPVHHVAGLWDGRVAELAATDGAREGEGPAVAVAELARRAEPDDERTYRALWKRFYDSVAIEERANPELRRRFIPKRFWKDLPEMAPDGWGEPAAPAGPDNPKDAALAEGTG